MASDDESLPVWSNVVARRFTQRCSLRRCEEPEQRGGRSELETNFRRRIGRHYATRQERSVIEFDQREPSRVEIYIAVR